MTKEDIELLRKKLKSHVAATEGKEIRKKIRLWSIKNYNQKYSDTEHMNFIKRNLVSTEVLGWQSSNFPYYYEMFSGVTQHIYGDTMEELFDKAIDIENSI